MTGKFRPLKNSYILRFSHTVENWNGICLWVFPRISHSFVVSFLAKRTWVLSAKRSRGRRWGLVSAFTVVVWNTLEITTKKQNFECKSAEQLYKKSTCCVKTNYWSHERQHQTNYLHGKGTALLWLEPSTDLSLHVNRQHLTFLPAFIAHSKQTEHSQSMSMEAAYKKSKNLTHSFLLSQDIFHNLPNHSWHSNEQIHSPLILRVWPTQYTQ